MHVESTLTCWCCHWNKVAVKQGLHQHWWRPVSNVGFVHPLKASEGCFDKHCAWASMRLARARPSQWAGVTLGPGLEASKIGWVVSSADIAGTW